MARILVVDDDPDILQLVQMRLRGQGHRTIGAGSAAEALELVQEKGSPDLAVLDVTLPGMSGLDLLRELRTQDDLQELPVIFLSARVQQHEVEAGRALGALYLTKPFVASALFAAIDRALPHAGGDW